MGHVFLPRQRRGFHLAALIALVIAPLIGVVQASAAAPIDPDWSPPRTVYIPETGQTIDQLFLDLWLSGGGATSWGNPVTPEIADDNGSIVQYYEYARFEYWPNGDGNGNVVTLGNVGAELRPLTIPRRLAAIPSKTRNFATSTTATAAISAELTAWAPFSSEVDVQYDDDVYRESTYRFVEETGHGVWGGFRAFWEATGEAAYLGNPLTEEWMDNGANYQVFERGKLVWREGQDVSMLPVGDLLADRYQLDNTPTIQGDVPTYSPDLFVPPIAVPDETAPPAPAPSFGPSLVISLSDQALWAFDNGRVVRTTYVSTGKEKFKTPTGLFYVNSKVEVQDMAGVLGGEEYDVPQVPDVMYFTDRGHAIHGAYWHNEFGTPMSHGCINLPLDVSSWLYQWAPVGMPVLIVQ